MPSSLKGRFDQSIIEELLQQSVPAPAAELNKFLNLPLNQSYYEPYMAILHRLGDETSESDIQDSRRGLHRNTSPRKKLKD